MKHTKIAIFTALSSVAFGQGLYNMSNLYSLDEGSSPLQYKATLGLGYDSNTQPINSDQIGETESAYIAGSIKAGFSHNESNYTLSTWAEAGFINYFDSEASEDDFNPTFGAGLNYSVSINERVRFNSRNFINYGFEPDYERGISADRRQGLYTAYASNNDFGIRWNERFATVHGVSFRGTEYEENGNDFLTISYYNQARYRVSPRTVVTGGYTYNDNKHSKGQNYTVGVEHSLTQRTGFSVQAGISHLGREFGGSNTTPFVNASVRHAVSERLSVTGYVSYDQDDNFRRIATDQGEAGYSSRNNLRLGLRANYSLSEDVALFGGVSVVNTTYIDAQNAAAQAVGDTSATVYNLNIGSSYRISPSLSVVGSYNFTHSTAEDANAFEYDRQRLSLGVEATF